MFRPEDIYAGNLLSGLESIDQGVTTTLDWSHALRTPEYGEAALQAIREIPGRFVLALRQLPRRAVGVGEQPGVPEVRHRQLQRARRHARAADGFRRPGEREFPSRRRFQAARDLDLRVTTHAGVLGVTTDMGISHMYDGGWMTDKVTYVHASSLSPESYQKIAATGGTVSVATESEQSAGQGYPSTWEVRKFGIPTSLSMDTSVWWSADFFSAMRSTLSAFRSSDHLDLQAHGEAVNVNRLRAEDVVYQATMGGATTLGMADKLGSLTPGKKADVVLMKNDESPAMTPILNPYAHVVYQAGTADVHTVVVDGRVVKYDGARIGMPLAPVRDKVAASVDHVRSNMGERRGTSGCTRRSRSTKRSRTRTSTRRTTERPTRAAGVLRAGCDPSRAARRPRCSSSRCWGRIPLGWLRVLPDLELDAVRVPQVRPLRARRGRRR